MNKVPRKIEGQQKLYEGKPRYIFYVAAGLFGVVFSIVLFYLSIRYYPLFGVSVLISLGCALIFSAFHSKSRKRQFLLNVVKIFFSSAFISLWFLFILLLLAIGV
jgi:hypothetical protein